MKRTSYHTGNRSGLAVGLVIAATALPVLVFSANARADMCFGGGNGPPASGGSAGAAGAAGAMSHVGLRKRDVGMGLIAVASMCSVWLLLRRPEREDKDDPHSS